MTKRGHAEEQILRALHQAEGGMRTSEMCREHGISEAAYYVGEEVRVPGSERAARAQAVVRGEDEA